MFDDIELGREFFEKLRAIDQAIVDDVAAGPCQFCGGPLHRGDYPRKPRGGLVAKGVEAHDRRFSLCCGREGCRRRATPPSVRFLGRRVYAGAVVIVASVIALAVSVAATARQRTGIPSRTTRRWVGWWRDPFTTTRVFVELCARLVPAVSRQALPTSILERLRGEPVLRLQRLLAWLAPITTESIANGSRYARDLV
jgi:hypothetical protein